jgi:hypothetical protein
MVRVHDYYRGRVMDEGVEMSRQGWRSECGDQVGWIDRAEVVVLPWWGGWYESEVVEQPWRVCTVCVVWTSVDPGGNQRNPSSQGTKRKTMSTGRTETKTDTWLVLQENRKRKAEESRREI